MGVPVAPAAINTFDIYKAYLDDLGRVGGRHESVRTFYITVVSALFTFLGLGSSNGIFGTVSTGVVKGIGIIGAALSVAWALHMWSFHALFSSKIAVLRGAEANWPWRPFTDERPHHYIRVTLVDTVVAGIFAILFVGIYVLNTPPR